MINKERKKDTKRKRNTKIKLDTTRKMDTQIKRNSERKSDIKRNTNRVSEKEVLLSKGESFWQEKLTQKK